MTGTIDTTDSTFEQDVLQSDKPVVVAFWAVWCGPCRMFAPVLEEVATENTEKITIARINIDENPKATREYGIRGVPATLIFDGGKVTKQLVGARPKAALLNDLVDYLG